MSVTVAVVIPYFQRQPGILRRALASVLAQDVPTGVNVRILVVDDESPLPANEELEGFTVSKPFSLTVLSRPNGGPGRRATLRSTISTGKKTPMPSHSWTPMMSGIRNTSRLR